MKEKLWTKDFISVTATNFFLMLTFYLLMVTISVFSVNEFHSTESQAGLASSIFVIGALIGRLFGGKYIEIIGRKKLFLIGMVLMVVASILYFSVASFSLLIMNRILHGFSFGVAATATGTIVAQVIPMNRKGEGIGYFALSMTLATAIGPFIGIFILDRYSFNMIFIFCLICVIISLFLACVLQIKEITLTQDQRLEMKGFKFSNFIEPQSIPITLICTIAAFCYSGILSFLTFYAAEINLTETASFFFVIYAVAVFVTRPATGRLFDNKGANYVLYPALVAFFIGMFVLSQTNTSILLLLAGALIGFGYGTYMSSGQAIAIQSAPAHRTGIATSTFFILTDLGLGLGPFIQGYLVPSIGYSGLFFSLAILLVICLPLQHLLYGRKASSISI